MSRPPVWPPKLTHHRPSGKARVRWKSHDYYLGPWQSPEARTAYARLIAQLAAGVEPKPQKGTPTPPTVADVVAAWEVEEAPRYGMSRGGERKNFRIALRHLLDEYGPTDAATFDADAMHRLRMKMAADVDEAGRPRWCRNTINQRCRRMRTVWRWAETRGMVPKGSWANLSTLRGLGRNDKRVRHTMRRESAKWCDVLAVVRHLPDPPRTMLLLQWWTGMRPGEVVLMRPCDLNREGRDWTYRPSHHKTAYTGAVRVVPLGPKCRALLGRRLREAAEGEFLFKNRWGKRFVVDVYDRAVRRACIRAGVKVTPHQCRHSCKDRITAAMGLDVARSVLGQASLSTTNGYGQQIDLKKATEAARRLA